MNKIEDRGSSIKNPLSDFSNDGAVGALIASKDWSAHPLGPVDTWPDSLKYYLKLLLNSKYQMWMGWGPEYFKFYNDAYSPTLGVKHPDSLGNPARVIWSEIWDVIGSMLDEVTTKGTSLYFENLMLFLERRGFKEETYHTFSYSPLADGKGGIGGIFCAVSEDTKKVLSQRRLTTLHDLSDATSLAKTEWEVCRFASSVLQKNSHDIPFALIYLYSKEPHQVHLKSIVGGDSGKVYSPEKISIEAGEKTCWNFPEVIKTKHAVLLEDLSDFTELPNGPWDEGPEHALVLPIFKSGQDALAGFLVAGLSSRLVLDDDYYNFFGLVAGQIATALANVHALEEERRRAEALAEIDKAKTVFFSNVSHEFRTPLTLMLGPLQEILQDESIRDSKAEEQARIIYRNSLRLLRLVNTLLDFSRIEAGRVQAIFKETDILKLTADLSSSFRSAIESAGLIFNTTFGQVKGTVYVDQTMWERIVFNLLSNALKFTFEGQISVGLQQEGEQLILTVKDTGTGIPKEELPKLFSRFHRIENAKGRTHEGSGIGLAMVNELVRMHGGTIEAYSTFGEGSTFKVSIPTGKGHLPEDRIAKMETARTITLNAVPNLEEELANYHYDSELNGAALEITSFDNSDGKRATILVADDNLDMQEYLSNLLKGKYDVITASDGLKALDVIEKQIPQLIISDVMMPNMDGISLVQKLRASPPTSTIPFILVSARAGEEATIEGINAGADDYLVKPFSSRELLSRVESNIKIARHRESAEKNLQNIFKQAPVAMAILKGENHVIELANSKALELWGKTSEQALNKPAFEVFPELVQQGFGQILDNVYKTGKRFIGNEIQISISRFGKEQLLYINFVYDALCDSNSKIIGIMALGVDVTDLVESRKTAEEGAKELEVANKDILSKNELLTRINNDLDNFIYTASHDLKAPVANIEGLLHSLVETLTEENKSNTDFQAILQMIEKSIDRFKSTILDLTEVSKAQKTSDEDHEIIVCEEIIQDVMFIIQDQIKASQADIKIDMNQCRKIKFSRKNFQSIIYNLISNAVKYRDPSRALEISISTELEGDYMILSVKDNGLGISESNMTKLFTMFKRFHDHVEGTGIGLYIVKKVIDNSGGKIEVESKVGQGTTFRIFLLA